MIAEQQRPRFHQFCQLALKRFRRDHLGEGVFEPADGIVRRPGEIHPLRQALARGRGFHQQLGATQVHGIARHDIAPAGGKHQPAHQPGDKTVREVFQDHGQCLLRLVQAVIAGKAQQRHVLHRPAVVFITLDRRRGQIHETQYIGEAAGNFLLALERAAERQHGHVGDQRERVGQAREPLRVTLHGSVHRHAHETRVRDAEPERARGVAERIAEVAEQRVIESLRGP